MEVLKVATEWARAEANVQIFFIAFGVLFIVTSLCFWKMGKTKFAKAYIVPMLIAGVLLILLGGALYELYFSSIEGLRGKFNLDPTNFVQNEIERTSANIVQYKQDLFGVFPYVLMVASLCLIFIKRNIWRAIFITLIALSAIILLVDTQAIALLEEYNNFLQHYQSNLNGR